MKIKFNIEDKNKIIVKNGDVILAQVDMKSTATDELDKIVNFVLKNISNDLEFVKDYKKDEDLIEIHTTNSIIDELEKEYKLIKSEISLEDNNELEDNKEFEGNKELGENKEKDLNDDEIFGLY